MSASKEIEEGLVFMPKFGSDGLITAISQDADSGDVLMVAYMNEEALKLTLETGNAVFFSRSRQKLWKKGEESGHVQKVQQVLVDCDQDCLILKVRVDQGQQPPHMTPIGKPKDIRGQERNIQLPGKIGRPLED